MLGVRRRSGRSAAKNGMPRRSETAKVPTGASDDQILPCRKKAITSA
jgi:hypothetical protein